MSLNDLLLTLKGGSGSGNHGHAGIPGKRGGSAPSRSGNSFSKSSPGMPARSQSEAKAFATERMASLGYKAKFEKTKDGKLRVIDASNPKKPKPTKWHVLPDGRVVRINKGRIDSEMTESGIKLVTG